MTRYSMPAIVMGLLLSAMSVIAQETEQIEPRGYLPDPGVAAGPVEAHGGLSDRAAVEQGYVWYSRHFERLGPLGSGAVGDSNSTNFSFPIPIGNSEVRGIGQLFAPGVIYDFYNSDYAGPDTGKLWLKRLNDNGVFDPPLEDLTVITQQFQGAAGYSIDSVRIPWFKNPYHVGDHLYTAKFYVWSTPPSFAGNSYFKSTTGYQTRGFQMGRRTLIPKFETELTQEGFDTTIVDSNFVQTLLAFDPPLTFDPGAAAITMVLNDDLPALSNPSPNVDPGETREFQTMRLYNERIEGTKKRIRNYKAWATMLWRTGTADSVMTIWPNIYFTQQSPPDSNAAILNVGMTYYGTVDLSSGVKYHFGSVATGEGITAIVPNPATSVSRVNFDLQHAGSVALDLFNEAGEKVRSLVTSRYVPGVYSYDLDVSTLVNGVYLLRLQAGDQVYTQKVNVAK